ncbi:MAG: diguanylate cyclase [Candidatus Melainabacteria bacterium]|nr:diguanylate cyclase [Candidatus Melainabacteria bacterium]
MALHGSFSSGAPKSVRLSKMSSIPTTDDLRYALDESKRHAKAVELPFENYRVVFIIRVLHQGNAAPRWTFQRGDGPNSKIMWTRDTVEVLMIQNKIKTESAYEINQEADPRAVSGHQVAYQAPAPAYALEESYPEEAYGEQQQGFDQSGQNYEQHSVPPASMGFGSSPQPTSGSIPQRGFGGMENSQSMPAWAPNTPNQQADDQNPATSQSGMPAWSPQGQQQPSNSQQGMSSIPQKGFVEQSQSGRQMAFQPRTESGQGSGKILMPPKLSGFKSAEFNASMGEAASAQMDPQQQIQPAQPEPELPAVDPVYQGSDKRGDDRKVQYDMSGLFGAAPDPNAVTAPSAVQQMRLPPEPPPPPTPLPPAVNFDPNLVKGAYARLVDPRTGLITFDSLLFFLFREFSRFEKNKTGLSFAICEIVLIHNNQVVPLPVELLPVVAQRISAVCKPLDMAAYISGNEFAMLLDGGEKADATKFANALHQSLSETPLTPQLPANSTVAAIGIATIPGTCDHPGILVAAAQQAKEMAKDVTPSILLFPN